MTLQPILGVRVLEWSLVSGAVPVWVTVLRCQIEGVQFLSLSGGPLARLDRGEPFAGLQRVLDVAESALEPVYGSARCPRSATPSAGPTCRTSPRARPPGSLADCWALHGRGQTAQVMCG